MSGRGFNIIPSWRSTSFDLYFLCFFHPFIRFDVVAAIIVVVGFFLNIIDMEI